MTPHATIRFYGDLATLAEDADRDGEVRVPLGRARSVKDAIESCGVPHTEVDLIVVGRRSVGFGHLVTAGDRVSVYPQFRTLDVPSLVRPAPLPQARFLLDVHLGRLAGRMRLLGFDTAYRNDADDAALALESARDERWLLTRDRGLLMRAVVTHGYLVRANDPREQIIEVVRRFDLFDTMAPLTRCARCNGLLVPVQKTAIAHRLEPGTRREHDTFAMCRSCDQIYWEGSHATDLEMFIGEVAAARPSETAGEKGQPAG